MFNILQESVDITIYVFSDAIVSYGECVAALAMVISAVGFLMCGHEDMC